ncbi:hypothetical protein B0H98_10221 [Vreelandella songnenensis]|uniref:Uncharacterized protein n=1 Tax=Vreelandella songnenensis TaxID=1176243 RepID=A0A2T0V604_9GAMM|nr:hypothetical protein [Halomonas songnenensis]PRY65498.1 hypothetical protein B0H98_10221 [Halomonas songnenensis]
MQIRPYSAERISVALGLCVVMLAAVPRFMADGHETRQTLIMMGVALVAVATAVQWRLLGAEQRSRLPRLCLRLSGMLVLGALVMGAWHMLFTDWISWQVFISHAATCGLLVHAVSLWWTSEQHAKEI